MKKFSWLKMKIIVQIKDLKLEMKIKVRRNLYIKVDTKEMNQVNEKPWILRTILFKDHGSLRSNRLQKNFKDDTK